MRAIVITKPGGPEVLELRDVDTPEPRPGQVRVRIRACAVNRADLLQRTRHVSRRPPTHRRTFPVSSSPARSTRSARRHRARDGRSRVRRRQWRRVRRDGRGRTRARSRASRAQLDFAQAAAVPEAFVTAYDAMVLQGGLRAGDVVLVHAAGSGVGTAAIQIARAIGARSIGTARTRGQARTRARARHGRRHRAADGEGRHPRVRDARARAVRALAEAGSGGKAAGEGSGRGARARRRQLRAGEPRSRCRSRVVSCSSASSRATRADVDLGVVLRRRLAHLRHGAPRASARGEDPRGAAARARPRAALRFRRAEARSSIASCPWKRPAKRTPYMASERRLRQGRPHDVTQR